jgi:small conductance mechanosensitive channel
VRRLNLRSTLSLCAPLLAGWFLLAQAQAQDSQFELTPDRSEMTVAELSQRVSDEVASLRIFESFTMPDSFERRRTLEIRRDEKTIHVLKSVQALADRVLALPEEAPERDTLTQLMLKRGSLIEQTLTERFTSLTLRLNESLTRQSELSGSALLAEESFTELIDGQRLRYLELFTEQVLLLRALAIDDSSLHDEVVGIQRLYGEEMMGLIHLHNHGLQMLAKRQAADGTDADLIQAARFESERLQLAVLRLRDVVAQLDLLGGDTVEMRRTLIEERGSLALGLVDTDVATLLFAEATTNFKSWLTSRGLSTTLSICLFVIILIVARWLARVARRLTERALKHSDQSISQLLREMLISMAGTVVFLIGILVALAQVGVSVTPMIAGLGVVGFIVGFALQDTLSNFASGTMILAYRPFDTGDFISAADVEGTVRNMNLVNTTIVTIDNRLLIIPNSKIWGGVILNFTGQQTRRTDVVYNVSYSEDLDHVQRVLEDLIASDERFLTTPEPIVRVKQFSDSSIDFLVRAYVKTDEFWETLWALNKAVKQRFDAEGITIPFPQRDVHLPAGPGEAG